MSSQTGAEKFQFLVKLALENGAADAKIIPANKVVVEDRVVLKCKVQWLHPLWKNVGLSTVHALG